MSVVGAHSVSREWGGLILVGFLGQRVVQALSHPWLVGAAWSLGQALGDHLQSYPPGSMSLIYRATLRLYRVAPIRRTACPVRGALPRPDRGCPVTPAGVMECAQGQPSLRRGRRRPLTPSPVASRGSRGRRCPSVREPCSLCLRRKIRRAGVVEPVRGPVLAGTPVRVGGILGAHGPGCPAWLYPVRQVGGLPRVPGGRAAGYVGLETKAAAQAGW